jgi:nucleotide-binding universal stress UspA family protein
MPTDPIVVGTDGSHTAELAVQKAAELAVSLGAAVHVVNCYRPVSSGAWMAAAGGVAVSEVVAGEDAKIEADAIVARARQRLASLGVEARTHVCTGEPADALMSIADSEGAQMIVVGNRGMAGARRVLGSVPNRVSHHASCGVLIVPTC